MKDNVILITGASSGIGEALAYAFARHGSKVVLGARNLAELNRVAAHIQARCWPAAVVRQTDVTIPADCEALVQAAITAHGRLDVVIPNAGNTQRGRFEEVSFDSLRQIFELNFWGVLNTLRPALPYIKQAKGSIVGISSIAGYRGIPGRTGYSGSKFALNGFLEVLRVELMNDGVHVLTVAPGYTQSNIRANSLTADGRTYKTLHGDHASFRDEGKMMSAEAVAEAIYRATVARKRTLVLTRLGKLAVWLNKMFPALADRLVHKNFQQEEGAMV